MHVPNKLEGVWSNTSQQVTRAITKRQWQINPNITKQMSQHCKSLRGDKLLFTTKLPGTIDDVMNYFYEIKETMIKETMFTYVTHQHRCLRFSSWGGNTAVCDFHRGEPSIQRMHDSNLTHTGEHTSVKYMNLSKVFDTRFSIFFFL